MTQTHSASPEHRDFLLIALRVIVWAVIGIIAFAFIMVAIAAPAALIFRDSMAAELAAEGLATVDTALILQVAAILAAVAALLALAIHFFRLLLKIIDTVAQGDPFSPDNAERLTRMGWVAVIGQLGALLLGIFALMIVETHADLAAAAEIDVDVGLDGGGLILILVLFVLARVFRHGAAMREDLEGTV